VLDKLVSGYGRQAVNTMSVPPKVILEDMLDHCGKDELRAWRFLEGALDTAAKHIRAHGTQASLDLTGFDPLEAYNKLLDYIWGEDLETKKEEPDAHKPLKVWLVGKRFWVAARSRKDAPIILVRDTGHISTQVEGVDPRKKLYDENNKDAGTVGDMLIGIEKPQFIGVA
jgi:hypothetical protein